MVRRFLTPKWWGLHALLVGSLWLCYRLGLWQWIKGNRPSGSWVNVAYGVQWWVFAAFAVFLYVKLVLDELDPAPRERPPEPMDPREPMDGVQQRQAPPPADDDDDELAAYNRYLMALHAEDSAR